MMAKGDGPSVIVHATMHDVYKPACTNSASRAYLSEWKSVTCNVKGNR